MLVDMLANVRSVDPEGMLVDFRERARDRNINAREKHQSVASSKRPTRDQPATRHCALTRNQTGVDLSFPRQHSNRASHPDRGKCQGLLDDSVVTELNSIFYILKDR